jgi:hypothetical protein
MPSFLRLANWALLLLFGVGTLFLAVARPSGAILGALNLLPFAAALIAARSPSSRSAAWFSLLTNVLWSILYAFIAVMSVLGQASMPLVAFVFGVVVSLPCALNARIHWQRLRSSPALSSS